ncbi:hypothetical protein AA0112_g7349 [Alternaria arborescens]|nr:hypothetical protein AA0112_g7349 [Alternaria arborescens]
MPRRQPPGHTVKKHMDTPRRVRFFEAFERKGERTARDIFKDFDIHPSTGYKLLHDRERYGDLADRREKFRKQKQQMRGTRQGPKPKSSDGQLHVPETTVISNTQEAPIVHGISVTPLTQCTHWHSPLDIIAIKHFCCQKFYACISCHDACESHKSFVWPLARRDESAVLCGQCKHILTISEYMESGSKCTRCASAFNPGCKNHWALYFELSKEL